MSSSPALDRLVAALKRLPGIGEKSATRLAFFLLGAPDASVDELGEAIARLKRDTVLCDVCFNLAEHSPCAMCADPDRDHTTVCVVEEPADLASIERGGYRGLYHVLGGALAPVDGIGPDELRISDLERRLRDGEIKELIIATNPNAEGDATAHLLRRRLSESGIRITRIATGMPLGGDLEYADHVTVGRSMQNRRDMD